MEQSLSTLSLAGRKWVEERKGVYPLRIADEKGFVVVGKVVKE